jgi:hypothetical protein
MLKQTLFFRLQQVLNLDNLKDIFDVELSSWQNIMENITDEIRSGVITVIYLLSLNLSTLYNQIYIETS